MSFVKVHDKYEFPFRLELGEFVASQHYDSTSAVDGADAAWEAEVNGGKKKEGDAQLGDEQTHKKARKSGDNAYLLHSVLVHEGGVGGGHYYAYIRPNNGSTWYRFNDDKVVKVTSKEAIRYNYGMSELNDGHASAYMLLYVRESEAQQLLSPLTDTAQPRTSSAGETAAVACTNEAAAGIPPSLLEHLQVEQRIRQEAEAVKNRTSMYKTLYYFTEREVAAYHPGELQVRAIYSKDGRRAHGVGGSYHPDRIWNVLWQERIIAIFSIS